MLRKFTFLTLGTDKDKLRIRLKTSVTKTIYGKEVKDKYLYLGLQDNEENRLIAEGVATEINDDIKHNKLNKELSYYLPQNKLARSIGIAHDSCSPKVTLRELHDAFMVDYRKEISDRTYEDRFRSTYEKGIDNSCNDLSKQLDLIISFKEQFCPSDFLRICGHVSRLIKWGKRHKIIDLSFQDEIQLLKQDYASPISKRKPPAKTSEIDGYFHDNSYKGFSRAEAEIVIRGFEDHYKQYEKFNKPEIIFNTKMMANLVKFRYWTGCRPSEAIALRRCDVDPNFDHIVFRHGFDRTKREIKSLKTEKKGMEGEHTRKFPCGEKLKILLEELLPKFHMSSGNRNAFVFPNYKGKPFGKHLIDRHWTGRHLKGKWYPGVIMELVEQKKISQHLVFYSTRHTWITLQLQAGVPVQNVAKLAGNSPEMIMKHYASFIPNIPLAPEV